MAATDTLTSADAILTRARQEFEAELKAVKDQLLASQIEASMAKDLLAKSREAELTAHRVMAGLLAQFGSVSQIFSQAKLLAEHAATLVEGEAKTSLAKVDQAANEIYSAGTAATKSDLAAVTAKIEAAIHHTIPTPPISTGTQ